MKKETLFGALGIAIALACLIVFFFATFGGLHAYLEYETKANLPDPDGIKTIQTSANSIDFVHYGGMVLALGCLLLMAFFIRKAFEGEPKRLLGAAICALVFTLIPWIW